MILEDRNGFGYRGRLHGGPYFDKGLEPVGALGHRRLGRSLKRLFHLVFSASLVLSLIGCQKPPSDALEKARSALEAAAAAGAARYAEDSYRRAEKTLHDGWMEIARQKGRLAPLRNYKTADSLLVRACEQAERAARQANGRKTELRIRAQRGSEALERELSSWREALDGSLVIYKAENYWSRADMGLKTSVRLIDQGEYEAALQAVENGRDFLRKLSDLVAEYTNNEAQRIADWRRWVQETLADSRARNSSAVIVDKAAHKAHLIRAGKLLYTYNCELGYNSARPKLFAGDGATPEGKYKVTAVKQNGSKYYKALLLDYPNSGDKKRFRENKAKGIISAQARIGANIEIHGDGGQNGDWTDGCVALTNSDMDHIMRFVTVGTPVTIVRRSDQWP